MDHYARSALNFFAANPIDRLSVNRKDDKWLTQQLANPTSRIAPVWRSRNLVTDSESPKAIFLNPQQSRELPQMQPPIFLGVLDDVAYFALNLGANGEVAPDEARQHGVFHDLRTIAEKLSQRDNELLAYAKAITHWHNRQQHCSDCGSPTRSTEAGFAHVCTNDACSANHFPRTDPAIIVLVEAGEKALLARQATWPAKRYSVLAGFVEPGESVEDAVKREVREEANVEVADVHYHSSQPWPFPSSLMLGYMAQAQTIDLRFPFRIA